MEDSNKTQQKGSELGDMRQCSHEDVLQYHLMGKGLGGGHEEKTSKRGHTENGSAIS